METQHRGPTERLLLAKAVPLRLWSGKARIAVEEAKARAKGNLNSFTLFSEGFGAGKEVRDLH